jgi:hypothetical protein
MYNYWHSVIIMHDSVIMWKTLVVTHRTASRSAENKFPLLIAFIVSEFVI